METSGAVRTGITVGTALAAALFAYGAVPKTVKKAIPEIPAVSSAPAETVQYAAVQTAAAIEDAASVLPETGYLLRIDGNTISVYQEGTREPLETYELPAGALPDYDRILLEYGIKVKSDHELHALLEDYLS